MIAPVSEVSSCDYSNHLDINSAWTSPARVHLQRETRSSPARKVFVSAQNAFVAIDKHVRLQCDLYFEVSSRHYLVASDERVRLQCEIIFGGG